jgi:hypothetical protein
MMILIDDNQFHNINPIDSATLVYLIKTIFRLQLSTNSFINVNIF